MAGQHDDIETILQDCLENIQSGQETLDGVLEKYPHLADELRPALEAALWFRMRKATLEARPGFVNASHRRVLEKIQQEQAIEANPRSVWGWDAWLQFWQILVGQRRLVSQIALVLLLVFGLIGGTSGVAYAAQDTLPGDFLYPVKTSLERASIAVAVSDSAKANLHIRFAQRRLAEIEALLQEDRMDQVDATVLLLEDHLNSAVRHLITLRATDPTNASSLAVSLQGVLRERSGALATLSAAASLPVREEIDRILMVSNGVISLIDQTVNNPTEGVIAIETSVPELVPNGESDFASVTAPVAITTPSPTASPIVLLTPVVQVTFPFADLYYTETPTMTMTVTAVSGFDDDDDRRPTKTPRPTKTEKVKKPHPDPTRRPSGGPPDD